MHALTHYRLRTIWRVPAPPRTVYDVLADLAGYPAWWPELTDVRPDAEGFATECRPAPAYRLHFVARHAAGDPATGVLEDALSGDLDGRVRWTVLADDDGRGTRAVCEQDLDTPSLLAAVFAPIVRPAFRAAHARMMRHGEAGLRVYAAGYQRALGN